MAGLIVTGTDTGVGKTYFSCLLLRQLREAGVDAVGCKPVCCGEREDALRLAQAGGGAEPLEAVNPWWFRSPVAPAVAAEIEGDAIEPEAMCSHAGALAARHEVVVLEGVGGWEVPLGGEALFSDFAEALGWPVVVVAANRLGVLNHALLTGGAIRRRGLEPVAVVLNHLDEERDVAMVTNRAALAARLAGTGLIELMPGQDRLEPGADKFFAEKSGWGGSLRA